MVKQVESRAILKDWSMSLLLGILLLAALVGLGGLGYHAFSLHIIIAHLESERLSEHNRHEEVVKLMDEQSGGLRDKLQRAIEKYNSDLPRLNDYVKKLRAEVVRLNKWKEVADADLKASEMVAAATATLCKAEADAHSLVSSAKADAERIHVEAEERATAMLADASLKATNDMSAAEQERKAFLAETRAKVRDQTKEAQALLESATSRAASLIQSAEAKAEQIGGNGYRALKDAALYEKTAQAMRNMVEGYGDRYLVSQQSLLDELAEDFSHKQAGVELRRAREATAIMIANRTAAKCNYAEASRRETAINFVIDAFNGKVDSILSRVKHDNVGTLEEQVRNAFTLVNYGGRAFREAQITDEFLAARLDELKWAAIVQQLAQEEREEQRKVKEQMREEARAAKERARVEREVSRESELLRSAEEQARLQYERASDEQKAMFEIRLQEITAKLREAEERGQRAKSMAELTKKGYVYVISNVGSFGEDVVKIGLTRRWDPLERVRELGDSSVPFTFDVHATILSDDAPSLEMQLHRKRTPQRPRRGLLTAARTRDA